MFNRIRAIVNKFKTFLYTQEGFVVNDLILLSEAKDRFRHYYRISFSPKFRENKLQEIITKTMNMTIPNGAVEFKALSKNDQEKVKTNIDIFVHRYLVDLINHGNLILYGKKEGGTFERVYTGVKVAENDTIKDKQNILYKELSVSLSELHRFICE